MPYYICTTCGVQYENSVETPSECIICKDERQYLHPDGQSWTTLDDMIAGQYTNVINSEEKGLYSLKTHPKVGIGQTAYLIQTNGMNILWDSLSYLDDKTIQELNALGGIDVIALSHPHFYSSQVEWAKAFDATIYIHEDDCEWVVRHSERITYWSGESLKLNDEAHLHRLGGHFKGGAVLEWKKGNDEKGILFTGDTIQVVADANWVSFMYSFPNLIPLPASKVQDIADYVNKLHFNRLYNGFNGVIKEEAKRSVLLSAKRYIKALNGTLFST